MGIKINTVELWQVLEITPARHNLMLVGKHGIGKSKIIENYFTRQGKKVVTLFLGQMSDPGDIIGLPYLNESTHKTDFLPPYWFPNDKTPIILFLDELNRARPEILQTIMDLTLNKTLAGKKLPEGSQIISAINEGEEYQLTDLDPALLSRFNIYYFSPTVSEWLLWATEYKIDVRVINFIEQYSDCLDSNINMDTGLEKNPDRRSWHRVSELIENREEINKTLEKTIAGIVGISVALKFINFLKQNYGINVKQLLSNFDKYKKDLSKLAIHDLTVANEGIFRLLETEEDDNLIKKYVCNVELYIKWLQKNERREVLAHWTTLYNSSTYPKAKVIVLTHSEYIFEHIVEFIKDIKL